MVLLASNTNMDLCMQKKSYNNCRRSNKNYGSRSRDTLTNLPIEKVKGKWSQFYTNFCESIDWVAQQAVKLDEVMDVFKVMEAAFESARLKHSVSVSK